MISVPNRRPPLSGNSRWLILLSFLCITACGAGKHLSSSTVYSTEVVTINKQETPKDVVPVSMDSVSKKLEPIDIDNNTKEKVTPPPVIFPSGGMINIAVILPFNLDQIPLDGYVDDTTKSISGDPMNAIEFYLGCKLAKEAFNNPNLTTNVFFLDDKNDSAEIYEVLKRKPFPNVRYIIGPMYAENLKPVAEFGKTQQIPVISPMANSMYVAKSNSFYYNASPTIKTQYGYLVEELAAANTGKTVEVIYDATDSTQENISFLKNILQAKSAYPNPTIAAKYYDLQLTDDMTKALAQADTGSSRVILVYSNREAYIKTLLGKLKPVKNKLSIYTLSSIRYTKNLVDLKFPHAIYTTSPFYAEDAKTKEYAVWYEETYNKKPSEFFFQGYDLMNMVFDQISKNQPFQDAGDPLYYNRFLHTRFRFVPELNKINEIDYYENKFLYLLKYSNGIFVKVK